MPDIRCVCTTSITIIYQLMRGQTHHNQALSYWLIQLIASNHISRIT